MRVSQRDGLGWAPCKRLQQCNRCTCCGAAKGSRAGWYRRRRVLRHPRRTPWVPNGTGQRCVKRYCFPELHSLWTSGGTETKKKHRILLPALLRGKERRCSRHLLRKSKLQHLWVAQVRAASSTSWMTWGLAGTHWAPLSCERLDAPV